MNRTSDLAPLLEKTPIVLVVEDRLTKEYLYAVWRQEQKLFTIVAAGGHQVVKGVVTDLRKHDRADRVFGLVDTDFGAPNSATWNNTGTNIFRSSYHEAENMLLDWRALEGCELNTRHKRSAAELQAWAVEEARKQPWWLACRKRLRTMQELHGKDFPETPGIDAIASCEDAYSYVVNSDWCQNLQNRTTRIVDQETLRTELNEAYIIYNGYLGSDQWKSSFSGKEIFRILLSQIHDIPRSEAREADVELAIAVGHWQRENDCIPQELIDLKNAMKQRAGIQS